MKNRTLPWLSAACLSSLAAILLILSCTLPALPSHAQKPTGEGSYFPLVSGTTWVYRGTVKWFNAETGKEDSSEVALTTKVEKVIYRPGITFAVMSGFPADLDWSTGEVESKPFLLVETEKHEVFLDPVPPDFDYSKLEKDSTSLKPYLAEDNLFFRWPLKKGMKFGDRDQFNREDNEYCWFVEAQSAKELSEIRGLPRRRAEVSVLRFVTNPDDTTIELAPGIGVLSYEYHHHGGTADTIVKLVEFHPGPNTSGATGAKP